jgi:protoporphyrinogen/coproporphyrinogen III oxidase
MSSNFLTDLLATYRSGLLSGLGSAAFEFFRPKRPDNLTDESVGSFISRRFSEDVASNLTSALFHGIYAGDIWQLSARTLLRETWSMEQRAGSIARAVWNNRQFGAPATYEELQHNTIAMEAPLDAQTVEWIPQTSTFTLKQGLQQLALALEKSLLADPRISILRNSQIRSLHREKTGRIAVVTGPPSGASTTIYDNAPSTTPDSASSASFNQVVSTIPHPSLTPFVTVQVVNLYFQRPNLHPYKGFGFLIPESVPFEQNPERALGVIFDSDAVAGQDTVDGTKVTVMLGGRWWQDWDEYPNAEEGLQLAREVVKRHLGITDEPTASNVTTNHNCIPQYTVGYEDRLKDFGRNLMDQFNGKVKVVGSQFQGVSVNDCVYAAWEVAARMKRKQRTCGLDKVMGNPPLVSADRRRLDVAFEDLVKQVESLRKK